MTVCQVQRQVHSITVRLFTTTGKRVETVRGSLKWIFLNTGVLLSRVVDLHD